MVKRNLPANAGDPGSIPGSRRSPKKEMATHSSILAWEVAWTEESVRLQSMGSQEELDTTEQLNNKSLFIWLCRVLVSASGI